MVLARSRTPGPNSRVVGAPVTAPAKVTSPLPLTRSSLPTTLMFPLTVSCALAAAFNSPEELPVAVILPLMMSGPLAEDTILANPVDELERIIAVLMVWVLVLFCWIALNSVFVAALMFSVPFCKV